MTTNKQRAKLIWYNRFNNIYNKLSRTIKGEFTQKQFMLFLYEVFDESKAFHYEWIAKSAKRSLEEVLKDELNV